MEPLNGSHSASRTNLSSNSKWAANFLVSLMKKPRIQDFVVPSQSDLQVEQSVMHDEQSVKYNEELVKLSEEYYVVSKILALAFCEGKMLFRVLWKDGEETYQPIQQLYEDAPALVQEFLRGTQVEVVSAEGEVFQQYRVFRAKRREQKRSKAIKKNKV